MKIMVTQANLVLLLFLWTVQRHEGFQWRCHHHHVRRPSPRCTQKTCIVRRGYHPDDNDSHEIKTKLRRPLASFFASTPSPLRRITRLWAAAPPRNTSEATTDDDDYELNLANKTASELVQQAEAWRARAKAIREEVLAMETALQRTTSKRRQEKQQEVDDIIATLFSSKLTDSRQDQTNIQDIAETSNGKSSRRKKKNIAAQEPNQVLAPDPRVVADRLRRGRYNQEQILAVVDRLFYSKYPFLENVAATDAPTMVYDNVTTLQNWTDATPFLFYIDVLEKAAAILDDGTAVPSEQVYSMSPSSTSYRSRATTDSGDGRLEIAIKTRRKELVKVSTMIIDRKLTYELQEAKATKNYTNLEGIFSRNFGIGIKFSSKSNSTTIDKDQTLVDLSILDNVTTAGTPLVPMWVPAVFLPYIISSNASTVGPTEVALMEREVFTGSRFFLTSSDKVPGAALFRGNIRDNLGRIIRIGATDDDEERGVDNTTAVVFAEIQERMEAAGLGDKVQLFMMADPETEPNVKGTRPAVAAMEEDTKPVILALSKALSPDEGEMKKRPIQELCKTSSYPLALLSTMIYSISMYSLNPSFFDAVVNKRDLRALAPCIPLALSILFVQVVHEAAHYLVAKRRNLIIGPPVPVPSFHATTLPFFGCITPLRSFPKNRAALLDFALSGPLSAITVSFGLVIFGTILTVRASQLQIARFPVMSVASMKSSFLLGSILSWLAPKTMMLPLAQPVPMHPFFVVGASGLITNALNLLPIFRLDGGRACFAAVGPRQGAVISVFTLLLLISMVMSGASSTFIVWTFLVALLQRRQEIPPRDDVTEVDGKRLALWLLSFLLSVSIVAPFPGFRILNM